MNHAGSKVFRSNIFVQCYSILLLFLNVAKITLEMLITIMTPVVQVRELPGPIKKKSPGLGQNVKKLVSYSLTVDC